jgi:hypothetical protein
MADGHQTLQKVQKYQSKINQLYEIQFRFSLMSSSPEFESV